MKTTMKILSVLVLAFVSVNVLRVIVALFSDIESVSHFIATSIVSLFILFILFCAGVLMFGKEETND